MHPRHHAIGRAKRHVKSYSCSLLPPPREPGRPTHAAATKGLPHVTEDGRRHRGWRIPLSPSLLRPLGLYNICCYPSPLPNQTLAPVAFSTISQKPSPNFSTPMATVGSASATGGLLGLANDLLVLAGGGLSGTKVMLVPAGTLLPRGVQVVAAFPPTAVLAAGRRRVVRMVARAAGVPGNTVSDEV